MNYIAFNNNLVKVVSKIALLFTFSLVLFACAGGDDSDGGGLLEDTTPPVISLTGGSSVNLVVGENYNDLGATADDGSVVVVNFTAVNKDVAGSYIVTYNATDTAGNVATEVTRTVVVGSAEHCKFSVVDGSSTGGSLVNNGQGTNFTNSQYTSLLSNSADIIYSAYANLASSTADLKTEINSYCADATSRSDQAKRVSAQNKFKLAMNDLQKSLVHTAKSQGLSPALDVSHGIEVIYSWPLTNTCGIDKQLAVNNDVPGNLINRRGLDAIEYLLFVSSNGNSSCDFNKLSDFEKTKYTEFNALSVAEKTLRRCNYMNNVIDVVAVSAGKIKNEWDPTIGNFLGEMKSSNEALITLNKVTDAMYYLADVVKEDKLAQPMGSGRANTTPSCGLGNACPADVESPNARLSLDNLIANTLSFQELYFGGEVADKATNVGFDDWLITKGEVAVANKIAEDVAGVLTGLNTIKTNHGTLYNAVDACSTELETFFDGPFQDLTRGFRDNLLPRLGLQPPQSSTVDAD